MVNTAINELPPGYRCYLTFTTFRYNCSNHRTEKFQNSYNSNYYLSSNRASTTGTSKNAGSTTVNNTAFNWETTFHTISTPSTASESSVAISSVPSGVHSAVYSKLGVSSSGNFSGTIDVSVNLTCYSKLDQNTKYHIYSCTVPYTLNVNKSSCTVQSVGSASSNSGSIAAAFDLAAGVPLTLYFYVTGATVTSVN